MALFRYNLLFLSALAILIFSSCSTSGGLESGSIQTDSLDARLLAIHEDFELMGSSVALIANNKIVYSNSFGLAHDSLQLPMTTDTYVRIASPSKFITSMAVMRLYDQGNIDLDEDVSEYLGWQLRNPAFPDQVITLRHLMDHRSGIRDGAGYSQFVRNMLDKQANIRTLFMPDSTYFTKAMFSEHPAGTYFSYTNCTWGLVASLVEKVSGMRFDVYCKQALFDPLGIRTTFNATDLKTDEIAPIYRFSDSTWVPQVDDYNVNPPTERAYDSYVPGTNGLIYGPQGSLRTSLNDLQVIAMMLLNNGKHQDKTIIKEATLAYFMQDKWVYDGENGDTWDSFWHSYTKGMHFIENRANGDIIFPDRRMYGHPGIAYGLLSDIYIDPETKSGVIFITNGSKKEFEYADSSSFYQVEAETFHALYEYLKMIENQ